MGGTCITIAARTSHSCLEFTIRSILEIKCDYSEFVIAEWDSNWESSNPRWAAVTISLEQLY